MRKSLLITASWPLSRLAPRRKTDRVLAESILSRIRQAPVIGLDVPPPWGPLLVRKQTQAEPMAMDDLRSGFSGRLSNLAVLNREANPIRYAALDSLRDRFAKSASVTLSDLVPPEWLRVCQERHPEIDFPSETERQGRSQILAAPFAAIGEFRPEGLVVFPAPELPTDWWAMTLTQQEAALHTDEPAAVISSPPEIVEFVVVTPVDEHGWTLGGEITDDLWKVLMDAHDDPQELHEGLGVADTLCYRFRRPRTVRDHLREFYPRALRYLAEEETGDGYCEGKCLDEKRHIREWVDGKQWETPEGRAFAQERLQDREDFLVEDVTEWEMITARHQPSLGAEVFRLECIGVTVSSILEPKEALSKAYRTQEFREHVKRRPTIDLYWGLKPLIWQQLLTNYEKLDWCAWCRSVFKKTKGNARYCSEACKKGGGRVRQRQYRMRKKAKPGSR